MKRLPPFIDLYSLSEDQRIDAIGKAAMLGNVVGFVVEARPKSKHKRYIAKLQERYPSVCVLSVLTGPTKGVLTIKVGPHTTGN